MDFKEFIKAVKDIKSKNPLFLVQNRSGLSVKDFRELYNLSEIKYYNIINYVTADIVFISIPSFLHKDYIKLRSKAIELRDQHPIKEILKKYNISYSKLQKITGKRYRDKVNKLSILTEVDISGIDYLVKTHADPQSFEDQKLERMKKTLGKIEDFKLDLRKELGENYTITPVSKSNFSNITSKEIMKLLETLELIKKLIKADIDDCESIAKRRL